MTDVVHFGVKGMHWGVRKARTKSGKPAKRVMSATERSTRRDKRNRRLALAGVGLIVAGPELMKHSVDIINTIAGHKREEAGRKAAQTIFSDDHGIPSYSTIALEFNRENNTWE